MSPPASESEPSSAPRGAGANSPRRVALVSTYLAATAAGFLASFALFPDAPDVEPETLEAGSSPTASGPLFRDVTQAAGVEFVHESGARGRFYYPEIMGSGGAFFDFDGDGDLDLYLVNGNRLPPETPDPETTNALLRNEGDGTFRDVTAEAGVGDSGYGQGCCTADYDDDGDQDLYVTNFGPNVLFENRGDGTFSRRADIAADDGWGQSCAFFDADGDGDLDLYVQNYLEYSLANHEEWFVTVGSERVLDYCGPDGFRGQQDRLYLQDADGTFRDATETSGIVHDGGTGMGLVCADFDADDDVDVFVANDSRPNFYFENDGRGQFTERALALELAYNEHGGTEAFMGVDAGDFDGDGALDLVVPSLRGEGFNLYRNLGGGFRDVSTPSGLAAATSGSTGFAPVFLDHDADGDLDLFFTAGDVRMGRTRRVGAGPIAERYAMPDLLLENRDGRFTRVGESAGALVTAPRPSRACAAGDYDDDGDLDLLVTAVGGSARLWRNEQPERAWIGVALVGRSPNRDAIGARVTVRTTGARHTRWIHAGGSYLGQRDRRLLFGLGAAPTPAVDEVVVRWPDGGTTRLEGLATGRYHVVRQQAAR